MKLFFRKVSKKTWTFLCVFIAFEILSLWVYHRCTFLDWPIHVFSYQAAGPWMMNGLEEYGRKNPLPDKLDSRFYYSPLTISRCCHARYQDDKPYLQYHMFPSPEGPDFRRFISSKDDEIVYTLDISVSSTAYEQRNEHFYCHGTKRGSMKQLYPEGGR